ncbi:hypothetical protein QYM36_009866 [Artemia franciscana]|uniref:E3 UFM1-protein ligase 1 homolog n=1 Tax=Artemia franciscana TaxID=6661 RepID=A0AA88HSL9_ARTSF|nr:hypothetical protein QYM36_009866 [Artemia franciscana]
MSGSTWEEVKKLAADFQKAQLSSAVQRLSERNCVEVINKLVSLKLVDILYTIDGKEYITRTHLAREIVDELISQGGKANLTDLVYILNVDYSHIEDRLPEVTRLHPGVKFVNGQLLDKPYIDGLALEVNEVLQRSGQVYIPELVKQFDLPGDFVLEQITQRVGTLIDGRFEKDDKSRIFTDDFILQMKAKVRGILSAATRPVSVASLVNHYNIPERQFFNIADELLAMKRISGSLIGGRQASKANFIPSIFTQMQQEWVDNFYKQNGYLEYSSLRQVGIGEPESYVKKHFAEDASVVFLPNCAVGKSVTTQVEACVDDALSSNQFIDIMPLLPSVISMEDASKLLKKILIEASQSSSSKPVVFGETCVTNEKHLEDLTKLFEKAIQEKANMIVTTPQYIQFQSGQGLVTPAKASRIGSEAFGVKSKKEDRRKRASEGKAGGGTQGRETKTKATKKKYMKGRGDDSESEGEQPCVESKTSPFFQFLPASDLIEELRKDEFLQELSDDILEEVASYLLRPLNLMYEEAAKKAYEALVSKSSGNRKLITTDLSDRIQRKLENFKLYEKGLNAVLDTDLRLQLDKFLVKSYGVELYNNLVQYCAIDNMIEIDLNRDLTTEVS